MPHEFVTMRDRYLMVPIEVNALCLSKSELLAGAMADFSRLPYFDGQRDVNTHVTNISESIVTAPFQNCNFLAPAGTHLHWRLPKALCKGKQEEGKSPQFPAVPNRWLITRRGGTLNPKAWVVESDYLWPEKSTPKNVCIPFPAKPDEGKYQPFRFLGRQVPLNDWPLKDALAEYWGNQLTAIGYGDPAFAAFYPNAYSVFGCYDAEVQEATEKLNYDVWGWYSDPDRDYLKQFLQNISKLGKSFKAALEDELKWIVNGDEQPTRMLCYGRLTFQKALSNKAQSEGDTLVTIALANTGTEALSAYLAEQVTTKQPTPRVSKQALENYLEALQLSATLEGHHLDLDTRLKEARHEKGFTGLAAGILWRIEKVDPKKDWDIPSENEASGNPLSTARNASEPLIPDELASALLHLNKLQEEYNRALHEIESRQDQLFADWYKYIVCAYPPIGRLSEYPRPDRVKHFIQTQGIAALDRLKSETGILTLETDDKGKAIGATASPETPANNQNSLAYQIADSINLIVQQLDNLFPTETRTPSQIAYQLQPLPAPRYWQPNEPVVMVVGEAARFTAPPISADQPLTCTLWNPEPSSFAQQIASFWRGQLQVNPEGVNELLNALDRQIAQLIGTDSVKHPGQTIWQQQPWNPFMLEWEVAFYPTKGQSSNLSSNRNYPTNFLSRHYQLNDNAIDLKPQKIEDNFSDSTIVQDIYSGRSFLSSHATLQHEDRITDYFSKQPVFEHYCQQKQLSQANFFPTQVDNFIKWLQTQFLAPGSQYSESQKAQYAIYISLLRAYQELRQTVCLSQCLSGLNQALLGRRQTLQLDITDPIGFPKYQTFADLVSRTVASHIISAPQPLNFFNPIRAGSLKVLRLRLVDTFGQSQTLQWQKTLTPDHLKPTEIHIKGHNSTSQSIELTKPIILPPRLVQGTRLNFRWLSGNPNYEGEASSHPCLNPICGWILPDFIDNTLEIYDAAGHSLGEIEIRQAGEERWRTAPQTTHTLESIENPYLKRVLKTLCGGDDPDSTTTDRFLEEFIQALRTAWENIEPEDVDRDPAIALIMGQPIAVVRATLNLQLQGQPAINQDWSVFRQDLERTERETNQFEQVQFPIRLGDYRKLSDGLVGYWLEDEAGNLSQQIYIAQAQGVNHERIVTTPHLFYQTVQAAPQVVTALIDPRAKVHAVTGIAPTKDISIPKEHYVDALKTISISFLTAPILTPRRMHLPLPDEQGYTWSWFEQDEAQSWSEISTIGEITREAFIQYLQPQIQSCSQTSGQDLSGETIWEHLLNEVSWLIVENDKVLVTPYDKRSQPQLEKPYQRWQKQIETALDVCAVKIRPVQMEAVFAKQELREGWLKLKKTKHQTNSS
ncbi:hypothetical protein H6G94_14965 [Nostoc punctiforme FACHB-252]|uniref:Uncharacterized protein n=2 Tax=Nostoc punctiforme TaxID=272131 RepID=A0ABR8HAW0_NOSPU|nr:hypothetical protein [Nostoc punctiforme FACHB-252]